MIFCIGIVLLGGSIIISANLVMSDDLSPVGLLFVMAMQFSLAFASTFFLVMR